MYKRFLYQFILTISLFAFFEYIFINTVSMSLLLEYKYKHIEITEKFIGFLVNFFFIGDFSLLLSYHPHFTLMFFQ
jgi:hypothetical protein